MTIYEKFGFKPGINACGTVTRLGGTRLSPEVTKAMTDASKSFIPMHDFHKKAGEYVAELLGVEACCITCGAAAGLAITGAACMSRGEQAKVLRLPDTTGMPGEILMLKSHRILYDQAILLSGARVKEIGSTSFASSDLVEAEINENTALFVYIAENENVRGSVPLPELISVLKKHNIPIVVDAAAELPPVKNIIGYLKAGADMVLFSGGKEIRGPQDSGLILGSKEFIDACTANCCPNYSIGRSMKISKEVIAGLVAAVELFVDKDYDKQIKDWEDMSNKIAKSLENRTDIEIRTGYPTEPGIQPVDILRVFLKPLRMSALELQEKLQNAPTPVYVNIHNYNIVLNPQCLEPEELDPLIEAFKMCLD